MARKTKSPRLLAALALLLGLCICKPPEATRLATSQAFGLPRGAFSYMPRKQQRVRVLSAGGVTSTTARAYPRGPKATLASRRAPDPSRVAGTPSRSRIRPRPKRDAMSHPLRC